MVSRALALASVFVLFCATALLEVACGATASTKSTCNAGRSVECTGARGCRGYQVCRSDGSGYDACLCDSADAGFSNAGAHSGLLGATCVTDADCRGGLTCLTADSKRILGEGPSAGLCVADCASDPNRCTAIDPSAQCVVLDDNGTPSNPADDAAFCLMGCKVGNPAPSDDKCRGRVDSVCNQTVTTSGIGYCRPACRSDVDCRPRHCDLRTGLCSDTLNSGDPIGSACTPASSSCAGGCIPHGSTYAECSGVCSYMTPGCGQPEASGPPFDYFCYLDPIGKSGAGDLGYCARLCDCDSQCGRSDAVCEPRASLTPQSGRAGVCGSKLYASGGIRPGIPNCP